MEFDHLEDFPEAVYQVRSSLKLEGGAVALQSVSEQTSAPRRAPEKVEKHSRRRLRGKSPRDASLPCVAMD